MAREPSGASPGTAVAGIQSRKEDGVNAGAATEMERSAQIQDNFGR